MRDKAPITLNVQISPMTAEEEAHFWTALDGFLEVFVVKQLTSLRPDDANHADPKPPNVHVTDPT